MRTWPTAIKSRTQMPEAILAKRVHVICSEDQADEIFDLAVTSRCAADSVVVFMDRFEEN